MTLRYDKIITLESSDNIKLYYTLLLKNKCKYIKNIIDEFGHLNIKLPLKAKQIDDFLKYIEVRGDEENDNNTWLDTDTPLGLEILEFAKNVCKVADVLEYDRNFGVDWSIEELLSRKFNTPIELIEEFLKTNNLDINEWRGPYLGFKWLIKEMKKQDHSYLSTNIKMISNKDRQKKLEEFIRRTEEINQRIEHKEITMDEGFELTMKLHAEDDFNEISDAKKYIQEFKDKLTE